jgi:hypothetical protein
MARFFLGLIAAGISGTFTWLITDSTGWAVLIGLVFAVLVWFGEFLLDDVL